MKPVQKLLTLAGAGLVGALLVTGLDAQTQSRPKSTLTITEPTEIPGGVVLQPGSYTVKVTENQASWNIVAFMDPNEQKTFGTAITTPHTAKDSAPNTMFVYYDTPAGENRVLRSWWPPNDRWGQDFVYPKDRAAELKRLANGEQVAQTTPEMDQYIASHRTDTSSTTSTDTTASTETSRSTTADNTTSTTADNSSAANAPSAAAGTETSSSTVAQNDTSAGSTWRTDTGRNDTTTTTTADTDTTTRRSQLPRTASPFPLLALAGLGSLGLGVAVRRYAA